MFVLYCMYMWCMYVGECKCVVCYICGMCVVYEGVWGSICLYCVVCV